MKTENTSEGELTFSESSQAAVLEQQVQQSQNFVEIVDETAQLAGDDFRFDEEGKNMFMSRNVQVSCSEV